MLILCSESYFTWYTSTVDHHGPGMPAFFQLLQLLAVILGSGVIATMTSFGPAPSRSVVRFSLDVAAGLILLGAACYWFFTLPMFESAGESWQGAAISALYPVAGVTIVTFMSVMTAAGRSYRWRSWERLITASFLLYGAGAIVSPIFYIQMKSENAAQSNLWANALFGFGYYLLFMAIVYRATSEPGDYGLQPWFFPRLGPTWLPAVYPVLVAAALPLLGTAALWIGDDPVGIPITASVISLALVLVARSWLRTTETVRDRARASTDPITGLRNYRYLRQRLASELTYAQAGGAPLAVITLGLYGLRAISNARGAGEVNRLLVSVAEAVTSQLPKDATLCRAGDDELVIVAPGFDVPDSIRLAEKLVEAAGRRAASLGLHVGLSGGVAVFPVHAKSVDDLIACSATAQGAAASQGDWDVVAYDTDLDATPQPASRLAVARTRSRQATARVLAAAVDARDPDTRRHSENVAELASALALVLDLPAERARVLQLAAQMHDIGKIGIPDTVLNSRGALTADERETVQEHSVLGERILACARLDEIAPTVRHHHERWDGTGYPDGLSGEDIPVDARILAVCDAYESMTAAHSHSESMTPEAAVEEIARCAGTQFDPEIAEPFCRMIRQIHGATPRDRAGRAGAAPAGPAVSAP
jgi:diguanylate cyclase (GGDEF)-like protein